MLICRGTFLRLRQGSNSGEAYDFEYFSQQKKVNFWSDPTAHGAGPVNRANAALQVEDWNSRRTLPHQNRNLEMPGQGFSWELHDWSCWPPKVAHRTNAISRIAC